MAGVVAGIVVEYNPFHKGHEWMISQLRRGGVSTVVCVMSGPFVQRAQPACLPTHTRAKAALAGGADLVLRLPAQWALSSAEGFAAGGVGLLAALGCVDILAFGGETVEIQKMTETAEILLSGKFAQVLKKELTGGISFAAARGRAAEQLLAGSGELLQKPNNILGVEYCKALMQSVPQGLRTLMAPQVSERTVSGLFGRQADEEHLFALPVPLVLPRTGAGHDGMPESGVASASWLREKWVQEGVLSLAPWVPEKCLEVYKQAQSAGSVISASRWELALLAQLRGKTAEDFMCLPDSGEGLAQRLAQGAKLAVSADELYSRTKSKRFAHSRVRRLAVAAALGLPPHKDTIPPFIQVLAANGKGIELLRTAKQKALLPVGTSLARLSKTSLRAGVVARIEAAAEDMHALCRQKPAPGGEAYTAAASMYIAKKSI